MDDQTTYKTKGDRMFEDSQELVELKILVTQEVLDKLKKVSELSFLTEGDIVNNLVRDAFMNLEENE